MRTAFAVFVVLVTARASLDDPRPAGLRPGDEVVAWEPVHVAGPHAGTKTCPVCTYLDAPVLLAFAKDDAAAKKLAKPLEAIAAAHAKGKLRVLLVVVDGTEGQLKAIAKDQGVQRLMLCYPDPERKEKQLNAYKIDPAAENTVVLYQDYVVKQAWAGLAPVDLPRLKAATDRYLPKR